jgi:hypothetical protein
MGLANWTNVDALRSIGHTRLQGHRASWYLGGSGIFEGHLMLAWAAGEWVYVISTHIGYPFNSGPITGTGSRALRHEIVRIALSMRRYVP